MRNKIIILAASLAAVLFFSFNLKNAPERGSKHRIVFQLSNADTLVHKGFIKQLNNVLDGMPADIEVVVLGPGIEFALKSERFGKALELLNARGIRFLVCSNTMKEKKVKAEQLYPFFTVVPMGIGHIVKRQEEGWSYIKAGF